VYTVNGRTFTGIRALSEKFNAEEMPPPFMGVDMDGVWKSSLTLSRINYANLTNEEVDKKTGKIVPPKIKLTGNTIKSKTMSEYIEDFIDAGLKLILNDKGEEFVEYYNEYLKKIYFKQIPLKKIATKKKYKTTIKEYLGRGVNKNNQPKAKQAHMELILQQRNDAILEQYIKKYGVDELTLVEKIDRLVVETYDNHYPKRYNKDGEEIPVSIGEKRDKVGHMLYSEPELDTYLYYVNIGTKKSQGDSSRIANANGEMVLASKLISAEDLESNPELTGDYNVAKYMDSFNKRAKTIMEGFSPEIREQILIKDPSKREYLDSKDLVLRNFVNDDYDESLILEEKELRFWNRTGYDPNLIWKGFSLPSEHALDNLIEYKEKIEILNNKFKAAGDKRVVKSVNDKLVEGDFVLLKNFMSYDLYMFNGTFIEWRKKVFEEDKTMKVYDFIDAGLSKATINAKKGYVTKFKEQFKIPQETMLSTIPKGVEMFEEFYALELTAAKKKQKQIDADEDEALEDLKFLDSAGTDIERD